MHMAGKSSLRVTADRVLLLRSVQYGYMKLSRSAAPSGSDDGGHCDYCVPECIKAPEGNRRCNSGMERVVGKVHSNVDTSFAALEHALLANVHVVVVSTRLNGHILLKGVDSSIRAQNQNWILPLCH
jgi:hypothetical protein